MAEKEFGSDSYSVKMESLLFFCKSVQYDTIIADYLSTSDSEFITANCSCQRKPYKVYMLRFAKFISFGPSLI